MFRKGDTVVHPEHGAAVIEDISVREYRGETRKYLKLKVVHGDLTVNVPVESAPEVAAAPRAKSDRVITVLASLHALVERMQRQGRQHDFSVLRPLGTLLQMFSIVAAVWGTSIHAIMNL